MTDDPTSALVNFAYYPQFRPIRAEMLSMAALYAIRDLKSSTSDEVREKIKDDTGYIIQSDKYFCDRILSRLWKEGWIRYEGIKINCTKEGEDYCRKISDEYDSIESSAFEYFMKGAKQIYEGKNNSKFPELSSQDSKSIKEAFFIFLKCMSQAELRQKLYEDGKRVDCIGYFKNLNQIDRKVLESFVQVANQLSIRNLRTKEIHDMMSVLHSETVACYMLENSEVKDFFRQDILEKRICLDTNAIIAAVTNRDPNHRYMRYLLSQLKSLHDNKVNVFWFEETEDEFKAVLKASYKLVKALEIYSAVDLNRIADSYKITSFVRDFIKDGWCSIDSYYDHILRRYEKLRELCRESIDINTKNSSDFKINPVHLKNIKNGLMKTGKFESTLDHDATILARLKTLREMINDNIRTPISDYWLVTFDRAMIQYELSVIKTTGGQPICIGIRALRLLMEPYISAGVIETINSTKSRRLRQATKLNDIDFDVVSTFYSTLANEKIAEYLERENKEEFQLGNK